VNKKLNFIKADDEQQQRPAKRQKQEQRHPQHNLSADHSSTSSSSASTASSSASSSSSASADFAPVGASQGTTAGQQPLAQTTDNDNSGELLANGGRSHHPLEGDTAAQQQLGEDGEEPSGFVTDSDEQFPSEEVSQTQGAFSFYS
jgi:hypothetical protein